MNHIFFHQQFLSKTSGLPKWIVIRVHTVFESLGKMESALNIGKLVGVCGFYGLQSTMEILSAYQSITTFPRPNSSF